MQQTPTQNDNQLLSLIKNFNPLMSAKIVNQSKRQLNATELLIKKIDTLVGVYKTQHLGSNNIFGQAITDRKDYLKQFMNVDSLLRRMLLPIPGTITANIIDAMEERRIFKQEKKQERKDFASNFFENTSLGRTLDPKSRLGKQTAKKEFDRFDALNQMKIKKEQEIALKKRQAEMFGGQGGPSKKDLLELEKIKNTMMANSIRINRGKAAEKDFLEGKLEPIKQEINGQPLQSDHDNTEMIKYLKLIELNTRNKDSSLGDNIEKEREAILRPSSTNTQDGNKVKTLTAKDIESIMGKGSSGGGWLNGIMGFFLGSFRKKIAAILGGSFILSNLSRILSGVVNIGKSIITPIINSVSKLLPKLFSPTNLMKGLSKLAIPLTAIMSIGNGIMDGFKEYSKSGKIKDAIVAGLGGVFEFLTFGLVDKESVQAVANYVREKVFGVIDSIKEIFSGPLDYLIETSKKFYTMLEDSVAAIINKVKNFFGFGGDDLVEYPPNTKITKETLPDSQRKMIDQAIVNEPNRLKSISIPVAIDKIKNTEHSVVKSIRKELESKKQVKESSSNTKNVVSAPTINANNTTNINQKAPVRNTEASYNRYLKFA